jgi:hypothetical protein
MGFEAYQDSRDAPKYEDVYLFLHTKERRKGYHDDVVFFNLCLISPDRRKTPSRVPNTLESSK